jgi:hypothetical protein
VKFRAEALGWHFRYPHECKTNRARRRLSRRKKGSATQAKARRALAREYDKIANGRADFAHKFSASVANENSTIACETLGLKGMSKTKLAKSVHGAAHRETFQQIEYKASFPFIVKTTFTIFRAPRGRACPAALTDPPKVTTIRKEQKKSRNKRIFSRFASVYYMRARNLMLPDRNSISD